MWQEAADLTGVEAFRDGGCITEEAAAEPAGDAGRDA